jgi:MFS superfamily sulfate permease-like transporter
MGVIEFLVSCGASGVVYALFSGNPMTFLGPTGLTLAFITTLYRVAENLSLPFLPMYACTGLWTALFIALTSIFNLSNLMK